MKKIIRVLPLIAAGLLFSSLNCDFFNHSNPKGIYFESSTIFSVQALDTSKTGGFINFLYEFPPTITQTRVIVKRTDGARAETLALELGKPLIYNDLDTLAPAQNYSYALALLDGAATAYDTVKATTLHEVSISSPADTVSGDTVAVVWTPIERAGTKFLEYKVELFKSGTDPDSILKYLAQPVAETTVILAAAATEGRIIFPRDTLAVNRPYTVRVTTSRMVKLNYLTDTSVGNRVFVWIGPPVRRSTHH